MVIAAAADLITGQREREAGAYRQGVIAGFARGWELGLAAGLERSAQ